MFDYREGLARVGEKMGIYRGGRLKNRQVAAGTDWNTKGGQRQSDRPWYVATNVGPREPREAPRGRRAISMAPLQHRLAPGGRYSISTHLKKPKYPPTHRIKASRRLPCDLWRP